MNLNTCRCKATQWLGIDVHIHAYAIYCNQNKFESGNILMCKRDLLMRLLYNKLILMRLLGFFGE